MIRRAIPAALAALTLVGVIHAQGFQGPKVADAKPGDVRVIVTAAIRTPLDGVLAEASKAIGRPIVAEYGSARGNLKTTIMADQAFEVAILLPDVDADLLAAGKIVPGAHHIADVPVALAIRGDVPNPDVSTPAAIKKVLLGAKAVKYSPTGAALDTVKKVLGTLAIADQIHDASKQREPVDLAPGEYEMNIYPISEIIPNKALRNLGPVTPSLQVPVVIEATIGKQANDPAIARKLIAFLQGPAIDPGLKSAGMVKNVKNTK